MPVSHHSPAIQLRQWLRRALWFSVAMVSLLLLGPSEATKATGAGPALDEPTAPHVPLPTTLNDYYLPGTQPNTLNGGGNDPLQACMGCHVDHISKSYAGSMMANSARDPLFRAALRIANEDAEFGGEFCIRCHVPNAWLNGRSTPSDGSNFTAPDMQGVTCNVCHRIVAPHAVAGEAQRNEDQRHNIEFEQQTSLIIGSGSYIIDRLDYRRGPLGAANLSHDTQEDEFMRSSLMCATCHEIDNPLYTYDSDKEEFVLNALDTPAPVGAKLFPIERTYSEWQYSAFNTVQGVTGLSELYPGIKRATDTEEGPITVCQDCHMPLIESPLVIFDNATERVVGVHEWAGGSARWQLAIESFWDGVPGDVNFDTIAEQATIENAQLGLEMLQRAAEIVPHFDDRKLIIDVVNNTGHKLPTGYAEGRRMWLQVTMLRNSAPITVYGAYDDDGYLVNPIKVYEIKLGLTEESADAIGRPELAGEGFHFALNNKVFKDNRIPPRGWTNAQYEARSMQPVGAVYADGVYTDTTVVDLPDGVEEVEIRLLYQTASGEYLDFLETEADDLVQDNILNSQVNWGNVVGNLREQFDLDQPVQMDTVTVAVPDLAIAKEVSPASNLLPGQPITFTLTFSNPGFIGIHNVSIVDVVPSSIKNVTIETDLPPFVVLDQTGDAPNLAWKVTDIFDSADENLIYLRGKVSSDISADTVINNTVVMSGTGTFNGQNVLHRTAQASANVVVPRVQFAPSAYTIGENGGTIEITVTMDKPNPFADTSFAVTTQDATARKATDYVALDDETFTIPAGSTSGKFTIQVLNDDVAENNESFNVLLNEATAAALGATTSATIIIENEDEGIVVPNDAIYLPFAEK